MAIAKDTTNWHFRWAKHQWSSNSHYEKSTTYHHDWKWVFKRNTQNTKTTTKKQYKLVPWKQQLWTCLVILFITNSTNYTTDWLHRLYRPLCSIKLSPTYRHIHPSHVRFYPQFVQLNLKFLPRVFAQKCLKSYMTFLWVLKWSNFIFPLSNCMDSGLVVIKVEIV